MQIPGVRLFQALLTALALTTSLATAASPISIVTSNWKFTPNTITLKAGVTQTLHLTSSQGVHGLQSADLGIPQTMIMPGKTVDLTVTPKKPGTYVLHCAIMCGAGHPNMALTVKVTP
ncbi:MAG TPA: cupredoxin domain-containing protein [Candidatus Baltobacteraceae bacterium]|nr:cupredoxin domain-containing protein [Candidatus Baltobacteraceae bacterium]